MDKINTHNYAHAKSVYTVGGLVRKVRMRGAPALPTSTGYARVACSFLLVCLIEKLKHNYYHHI